MVKIFDEACDRRTALRTLGLGLAAGPMLSSLGISTSAIAQNSLLPTLLPTQNPLLKWATGGTASLVKKVYPDPFKGRGVDLCALPLTCAQTLGPCYSSTFVRKDISEGQTGIPMRMSFLVINENCEPVADAEVDVWHTSATGFYSGKEAAAMCTLENQQAIQANFFRGIQLTDPDGRCDFDSCFPGWYSGRTLHIHFSVRVGQRNYLTSQLYFPDAISKDIIQNYSVYRDRGPMDTDNTDDGIIPKKNQDDYLFNIARMSDGVMLASKTLVLRNSLTERLCQV